MVMELHEAIFLSYCLSFLLRSVWVCVCYEAQGKSHIETCVTGHRDQHSIRCEPDSSF